MRVQILPFCQLTRLFVANSYSLQSTQCLTFLQLAPTILHVDASAAARIAERGSFKDKTKALGIRYYHICEFVERGIVQIKRIPRNQNWADIGTAARGKPELELACKHIYGEI